MQVVHDLLAHCDGFEWDSGNQTKNLEKHGVEIREAEAVFFNQPQVLFHDVKHSHQEARYGILGITNEGRRLAIFFTMRHHKIRIISARDQQRGKERQHFEAKKEAA